MGLLENDQKHLTVAEGYVELGMFLDANAELEEIDPEVRHVLEVLVVRLRIYRGLEKWEHMQTVARKLALYDPENPNWIVSWAFATRRADSIQSAKRILLEAVEQHPKVALIHHNLACYDSVLGEIEVAKARLQHALKLDPKMRVTALDDEDLKPLWDLWIGGKRVRL